MKLNKYIIPYEKEFELKLADEDWMYIDSIGDLFLFQRRNLEGGI